MNGQKFLNYCLVVIFVLLFGSLFALTISLQLACRSEVVESLQQ